MGRVGRSYPSFEQAFQPPAQPEEGDCERQARFGAIVGVLCALGFIGWLFLR
jgi:hypothetical protein